MVMVSSETELDRNPNKEFKIMIITMFKEIREDKNYQMNSQRNKWTLEIIKRWKSNSISLEILKENKIKIPEIKVLTSHSKKFLENLTNRMECENRIE